MKILITLFFVALPAAAQACGGRGGEHGGCGIAPFLICAIIAALGYWVAQHAAKETANCIKRMGAVTGTILVIIGLLGILCATGSHVKNSMGRHSCCNEGQRMAMHDNDENEGDEMSEKREVNVKVAVVKAPEAAKKTTK